MDDAASTTASDTALCTVPLGSRSRRASHVILFRINQLIHRSIKPPLPQNSFMPLYPSNCMILLKEILIKGVFDNSTFCLILFVNSLAPPLFPLFLFSSFFFFSLFSLLSTLSPHSSLLSSPYSLPPSFSFFHFLVPAPSSHLSVSLSFPLLTLSPSFFLSSLHLPPFLKNHLGAHFAVHFRNAESASNDIFSRFLSPPPCSLIAYGACITRERGRKRGRRESRV